MLGAEDTASSYAAFERHLLHQLRQTVYPLVALLLTVLASLVADRLGQCYAGCQALLSVVELLWWLLVKCAPAIGGLLALWLGGALVMLLLEWSMGSHPL